MDAPAKVRRSRVGPRSRGGVVELGGQQSLGVPPGGLSERPPATSTRPFRSRVAVWRCRASSIGPVASHVPVAGSKSSALARVTPSEFVSWDKHSTRHLYASVGQEGRLAVALLDHSIGRGPGSRAWVVYLGAYARQ